MKIATSSKDVTCELARMVDSHDCCPFQGVISRFLLLESGIREDEEAGFWSEVLVAKADRFALQSANHLVQHTHVLPCSICFLTASKSN